MTMRVHRYGDAGMLTQGVASFLARRLTAIQTQQADDIRLCLSDGLGDICTALGDHLDAAAIDPNRIDLWWSDDAFVDVTDPTRASTKTLAALGAVLLAPGKVHPMPTPSANTDVEDAALLYANELGDTAFDLTILSVAPDGHVAGLTHRNSAQPTNRSVMSVRHAGGDRLTLSLPTLARSAAVWFVASGDKTAPALVRIVADDTGLPAGALRGRVETRLFADEAAAALLPWHTCEL